VNDDAGNIFSLRGKPRRSQAATWLALRDELRTNAFTIDMFAMNSFARRPMLMRPVPRPGLRLDEKFRSRPLRDSDITALGEHLETRGFRKLSASMIRDVVMLEADSNSYSPPAEKIRALVWDGKPRLDDFFILYCGIEIEGDTPTEQERFRAYVQNVTRCFFISVVARVFKPGCKVDHVLVLEGRQGEKKSSLLRVLALYDDWFSDSMPHDLADKDARQHLPGNLIVELAEIAQLKKSEIETVKAFITCQHDKYRPSFGRFDIDWPRQNVFVGTTNTDDYLLDTTGNRRFWPLRTTSIHVEEAATVVEQVYAEAYAAYDAGEHWWLEADAEATAREEQTARLQRDSWHERVAEIVALTPLDLTGRRWVSTGDVLETLGIPVTKRSRSDEMRIGAILKQLGGKRRKRRMDSKPTWLFLFEE
jgi:predicted P-loop ATPase